MSSILTVVTPATAPSLVALSRVKAALGIPATTTTSDAWLTDQIADASAAIDRWTKRKLAREALSELFRNVVGPEIQLRRFPVQPAGITVEEDGVALDADEFEIDPDTGHLYRLDASGNRQCWLADKVVVAYTAGYKTPVDTGGAGIDLPRDLQAACINAVVGMFGARGRDVTVKSEDVPGLGKVEYWVGALNEADEAPPDVERYIVGYRQVFV